VGVHNNRPKNSLTRIKYDASNNIDVLQTYFTSFLILILLTFRLLQSIKRTQLNMKQRTKKTVTYWNLLSYLPFFLVQLILTTTQHDLLMIQLYVLFYLLRLLIYPIILLTILTHYSYHRSSKVNISKYIIKIYLLYFIINLLKLCGDIHSNPGPIPNNKTNKNLQICHINARSLTATDRLEDIIIFTTQLHVFDIIAITETHLGPNIPDTEVQKK
jgi:hypothetical protein